MTERSDKKRGNQRIVLVSLPPETFAEIEKLRNKWKGHIAPPSRSAVVKQLVAYGLAHLKTKQLPKE